MSTLDIVGLCIVFFLIVIPFICIGLYILLPSPCVLEMDKKENSCIRKKKFIWQKKYKIEHLCKLSEIKNDFLLFASRGCELHLKLKNGKKIYMFSKYGGRYTSFDDMYDLAAEINRFLRNNDEHYTAKQPSSLLVGIFCVLGGLLLFYLSLLMLKSM